MKCTKWLVAVFFLAIFHFHSAQHLISNQNHAWVTYLGNHKLTNKFSLHTEYQWRRADGFENWQQSLKRIS
jgi:hypothetical protein